MIAEAMLARKASKQNGKQMPGNVGGGSPGKQYAPSVMNAVKASPAGMFPAAAAKAGISMGSKLGQAITKSGTGKLPAQMQNISKYNSNLKKIAAKR